jgi:hypothetical protein
VSRVFALAVVLAAPAARAEPDPGEPGAYGLLDADFELDLGVGGGPTSRSAALAAAELRFRYIATASLVMGWEGRDAPGGPRHAAVGAVELRPLFLVLFFENAFSGNDLGDLVLYGLGLTGGLRADAAGLSLVVGVGTECPLWRDRARGLFLRTEARGVFSDAAWQGASEGTTELVGLVLVQWHAPIDLALVR